MKFRLISLLTILASFVSLSVFAQITPDGDDDISSSVNEKNYSPYAGRNAFPSQVLWGDTHLHTDISMDAGAFGNRLGLDEAYKFSMGQEVKSSTGQKTRLSRPLDWVVIADHSDNMGFFPDMYSGAPHILSDPTGKDWYDRIMAGDGVSVALELIGKFSQGDFPEALLYRPDSKPYKDAWAKTVAAAERYNTPGEFTAFIGYEWTSLVKGNNMHRVVIYRDGGDKAIQTVPYTTVEPQGSTNPRDLWKWLDSFESKTGGDVLAIAHNGNLANGIMFPLDAQYDGRTLDEEYVNTRSLWEPLYEVTQIKGDGETHPYLSPDDEFADYETWDIGNLDVSQAKTEDMLAGEYAREALKRGMLIENRLGTNPYKFGMIGSTDSHTSLAAVEENNFFGKHAGAEPSAERMSHNFMESSEGTIAGWQMVASGLAAVWSKDNTREAIFDAMERREVYATTGSRMTVRFFGGFDFVSDDATNRLPAEVGYRKGVPMGGEMSNAPSGKSPNFLIAARMDPMSGNLDRIQVIKGWVDSDGASHEKVYNVAWSGDRKLKKDGSLDPVGNTVDVKNATWTNTIGVPELITVWTDPDFDSSQKAFYYVRVLEIPTPRWTAFDAKFYNLNPGAEVEMTTQERAYTSPIWYNP